MQRSLVLVAAVAAVLCAPVAGAAPPADSPQRVTIVLELHPGAVPVGRFSLSGALSDSGVVARRTAPVLSKRTPPLGSTTLKLRGRNGTITIAFFGPDAPVEADWGIASASGAYAGLRGGGEIASRRFVAGAMREVLRGVVD